MHYLIDGYNLLFKSFEDEISLKEMRDELIEFLKLSSAKGKVLTLVFDGHLKSEVGTRGHCGDLEVVYTSKGETADEWILGRIQRGKPVTFTVVTSDKSLGKACRLLGAHTATIAAFLKRLTQVPQLDPLAKDGRFAKTRGGLTSKVKGNEQPPPHIPPEFCFEYYLYKFENPGN